RPGDTIRLDYFVPDENNKLQKRKASFTLRKTFKLVGSLDDPDLTPEFPGITDKLDMRSWEHQPFPFRSNRIKKSDEEYWKRYRTTPRAYISLKKAQELWAGRFGKLTSIRVFGGEGRASGADLLAKLDPGRG